MRVDANVVIRHLVSDPPEQAERAHRLFAAATSDDVLLLIEDVVLAEVVWTLSSFYRYSRAQIADALLELFLDESVTNPDKDAARLALVLYHERPIDFADALLAARALTSGDNVVCSFDRDFDRIPGVARFEPE